MRRSLAVLVLGAVAAACGREARAPSIAVSQFYSVLDAAGIHRVPDAAQMPALAPLLADSLRHALETARRTRESSERAAPGDKPPFADGDIFSSLFEGRSTWVVKDSLARGDTTFVLVQFSNETTKPAVTWQDTVVVVAQAQRFVIADIRFGTAWEFGFRGRLLELLTAQP
jgi:hypothetical protein